MRKRYGSGVTQPFRQHRFQGDRLKTVDTLSAEEIVVLSAHLLVTADVGLP
jgi:hypothetical protein